MFYCEHHHWPKKNELEDYNQSDTIVHRGNGFIVYETAITKSVSLKKLAEPWGQRFPILFLKN